MKLFILLSLSVFILQANVYYSKVEPYEVRKIAANVQGVVTFTNESILGEKLTSKAYIKIDDTLNKDELKAVQSKLNYMRKMLLVSEKILNNLTSMLEKKQKNYDKIKILKIKSILEKDREFYDLLSSENSYLSTQKEINTLKSQIADLEFREAQLTRIISDKNVITEGFTLYSIDVKVGQVVNQITQLATLADTSRAILTIYLSDEELLMAQKAIIYIDDQKTKYKIDRFINIADNKNISKYKVQIIIQSPKIFSKLVKVELKPI